MCTHITRGNFKYPGIISQPEGGKCTGHTASEGTADRFAKATEAVQWNKDNDKTRQRQLTTRSISLTSNAAARGSRQFCRSVWRPTPRAMTIFVISSKKFIISLQMQTAIKWLQNENPGLTNAFQFSAQAQQKPQRQNISHPLHDGRISERHVGEHFNETSAIAISGRITKSELAAAISNGFTARSPSLILTQNQYFRWNDWQSMGVLLDGGGGRKTADRISTESEPHDQTVNHITPRWGVIFANACPTRRVALISVQAGEPFSDAYSSQSNQFQQMKKIALAIAALVATSASFAQSYYVEGTVGSAHINEDCSGVPSCSNNSTGYKLIGGYGLGNNLAAEVNYVSYGKASGSGYGASAEVKTHGFGVGLAYQLPLGNKFSFTLRGGVASNHTSVTSNVNVGGSKSKTAFTLGLGTAYAITKDVSVTAAYDISKANDTSGDMNVSLFSVGLKYTF